MQFLSKKSSKKESKMDLNSNVGLAPKRAIRHSWNADWHMKSANRHKIEAWPEDFLIEISPTLFDF